jgi:hypothetical protein
MDLKTILIIAGVMITILSIYFLMNQKPVIDTPPPSTISNIIQSPRVTKPILLPPPPPSELPTPARGARGARGPKAPVIDGPREFLGIGT